MSQTSATRRRLTFITAAAALVLTACGGPDEDGPSGSDAAASDEAVVLTEQQLQSVLFTPEALGPGFVVTSPDDEEDDDEGFGCLTDFAEELDESGKSDNPSADADYQATNDFELPTMTASAVSFDSVEDANSRFDLFREAIDGCERVDVTDDEATTELDVTIDDAPYTNLVDEQLTINASGTVEAGLEFPVVIEFSVIRIDNNVAFLAFTDLVEDAGDAPRTYATALVERLTAVMADEEPDNELLTVADPGDVEGVPSAESTGAGSVFSKLPLDGGSYTWGSGITMTLTVESVEPYAKKDDFCGDGSCGVALPEDTRVALRYEVSVPDDYSDAFDPFSCPGELRVAEGNDDDALGLVAGDLMRNLDGSILPGTTKFGVAEYYIKSEYIDSEFYIESSCGDDSFDETAFFSGTFNS